MYLNTCFFLYLCYSISRIKHRKSGSIINTLEIECSFNDRSFFIMSLYAHCSTGTVE